MLDEVDWIGPLGIGLGRGELAEGAVRPSSVVVLKILGQHLSQVVLVDDQQPVEEFPAQGADHPFADRVAPHRQLHPIRMIDTGLSG
jgi:hypothetical protein